MSLSDKGYSVPRRYRLGDHTTWEGVELVCTRDHYAGDAAEHPWDPGDGWDPAKAATLWTPNGPDEAKKLSAVLAARTTDSALVDRLYVVIDEAVG